MIYTLGDSFTKWHWPTWSDWLGVYLDKPVKNLAYPGYTNELIYYTLVNLKPQLSNDDTVCIMWTGNNRVCEWYDQDYVTQQDIAGFFPNTNGQLWFGSEKYSGLYKTHPDHLPSFTHMVIDNFDTILKTQWLLDSIGCKYHMMFWQNPWADTREAFVPEYHTTWESRPEKLTQQELETAQQVMNMPVVQNLLDSIKWEHFLGAPSDLQDSNSYTGLWEFVLKNPELLDLNHCNDNHPNTLAHHDWVTRVMVSGHDPVHRNNALTQARDYQRCVLPDSDYRTSGILTMFGEL